MEVVAEQDAVLEKVAVAGHFEAVEHGPLLLVVEAVPVLIDEAVGGRGGADDVGGGRGPDGRGGGGGGGEVGAGAGGSGVGLALHLDFVGEREGLLEPAEGHLMVVVVVVRVHLRVDVAHGGGCGGHKRKKKERALCT